MSEPVIAMIVAAAANGVIGRSWASVSGVTEAMHDASLYRMLIFGGN
jgi:hypothetical protein